MIRLETGSMLTLAFAAVAGACSDIPPAAELPATTEAAAARGGAAGAANALQVTATHQQGEHLFRLSRDEIPSGWTTIQFANASHADHFVLLYRAPEEAAAAARDAGKPLLDHWYETITVPFQEEFDPYMAGSIEYPEFVENLLAVLGSSVSWLVPAGGPGLTAAGASSETTVHLEAGEYILECYVKDAEGKFHSFRGMLEKLTVTDEASRAGEPRATARISVSQPDAGGIQILDDLRPGMQTFAITFGEQPAYGYEHLLGHNAHLVRLHDGASPSLLNELAQWMDWTTPTGLTARAPGGTEFLGGSMEMAAGSTAYLTVNLRPGSYAWIAEVPDPAGKNMLKTFTVPAAR